MVHTAGEAGVGRMVEGVPAPRRAADRWKSRTIRSIRLGSHVVTLVSYRDHMEVGIRELKARLSEYVARVAAGETVTVTDRGIPRAMLVPITGEERVARGIQEGWITRRSAHKPGAARPQNPSAGTPRSEEIIADDRGE